MTASVGKIKWFGGFNREKGVENKYGFLQALSGVDVFLHEKGWLGNEKPLEGQLVYFELEERNGRFSAKNAVTLTEIPDPAIETLCSLYKHEEDPSESEVFCELKDYFSRKLSSELSTLTHAEIERITEWLSLKTLIGLLSTKPDWEQNVELLEDKGLLYPLSDIGWEDLPKKYLHTNSADAASYLLSLDKAAAVNIVESSIQNLPDHLTTFCLIAELIEDKAILSDAMKQADAFIKQLYSGSVKLEQYLKTYIDNELKPKGGVMNNPMVGHIFSRYQFLKYLYEKDLKFIGLYTNQKSLQSSIDTFILGELFSLILAGNQPDQVYQLFLGRLWKGITEGRINPSLEYEKIISLLPKCGTINNNLSCEAVYWSKQNIFLCRGRECKNPKVFAQQSDNYLEFTIYDWLSHYGVDYLNESEPNARDFPIKLAGYFNRLREIFDALHCRQCSSLMLPELKYARVEYTEFENGQLVKKDMAPAYRLTVFKCPNSKCNEHQVGHYINHCMGFDCYSLIDSRDCKQKCDSGLYICSGCGSCCSEHAKSHPTGFCPDCGSPLGLYQENKYDQRLKKYNRYVECSSNTCNFNITSVFLSKRFYLASCVPGIH